MVSIRLLPPELDQRPNPRNHSFADGRRFDCYRMVDLHRPSDHTERRGHLRYHL